MLLVHQFRDSQVAEGQLAAMRRALRAARNPAETDTIGDERDGYYGGYFAPPAARLTLPRYATQPAASRTGA